MRITNHDYEWHPKYFAILTGLMCGLYMITAALNPKIITIFGLALPAGILTFPLCCIITDLLTEIYGFNRARQAVWTTMVCTGLFAGFTQLALFWPPADFWPHQEAYATIFSTSWRIALAGILAWYFGEIVNAYVVSRMKVLQQAKQMGTRFIGSTVVGQFVDTAIFALVAFYGVFSNADLLTLFLSGWLFKVGYEIVALPITIPVTKYVKRLEGVEHFDRQKLSLV